MAIFRKKDEGYDDDPTSYETTRGKRVIKDIKPENRRRRKEPPKPWGKKERYIVLVVLLVTILASAVLAVSARDFKLPGLPRFSINLKNSGFNLFKGETITVGKGTNLQKKKADEIIIDFETKTKDLSGSYALYVIDLGSGYSFGIDEEEVMQAASLIKLPVMLYSQDKVDDSKIEAMGKRSDNAVFTELVSKFGRETLQNYIGSLGMKNTSIKDNETTPREIGDLLKKIYNDKNEKILDFLTNTIFENWLVKGVPENIRVAHKYGREVHVVNEAGIVYGSKPYIVVIMTQGVVEKEVDSIFPELSRLVYDGMNK